MRKKKEIQYKDKVWTITTHKDGSISIYCKCRKCGTEYDIAFDIYGEYLGNGQTV